MTAEALRALAGEVEGLRGPSRQTDLRIERAARGNVPLHWTARGGVITDGLDDYGDCIVRYTGSIDDAMALKPPRWRLAGLREDPANVGGWHATGFRPPPSNALESGTARTAALALTACWLRAIASDLEAKETTHG